MLDRYDPSTYLDLISPRAECQVYTFAQDEHGNYGVSGYTLLAHEPMRIALLHSPHGYGIHETLWGFWPFISSDAQGDKKLFAWDEEREKWAVYYDPRVFAENLKVLDELPVLIDTDPGDEA